MTARLGQHQRALLHDMRLYRGNYWERPRTVGSARRFTRDDWLLMRGLHIRGLTTSTYRYAMLTDEGRRVADQIIAEVWGRDPIVVGDTIVLVIADGPHHYGVRCGQHGVVTRGLTEGAAVLASGGHVADHRSGFVT
ncbi:hypothetical protein PBI_HILLTOPFARM_113 [Mycobacterium phage Hilltopfarm]|nr:hypothetical protein PBI_HILLTOPFARM_113 [Mycobacterium phage Hilltopfarm]